MANKRLIDANEALNRIWYGNTDSIILRGYASDVIRNSPTVDAVEVVHAEWIDGYAVDSNGRKVYDSIDCSRCEEVFKIESETREYWKARFKVCPFCGSIMDGETE